MGNETSLQHSITRRRHLIKTGSQQQRKMSKANSSSIIKNFYHGDSTESFGSGRNSIASVSTVNSATIPRSMLDDNSSTLQVVDECDQQHKLHPHQQYSGNKVCYIKNRERSAMLLMTGGCGGGMAQKRPTSSLAFESITPTGEPSPRIHPATPIPYDRRPPPLITMRSSSSGSGDGDSHNSSSNSNSKRTDSQQNVYGGETSSIASGSPSRKNSGNRLEKCCKNGVKSNEKQWVNKHRKNSALEPTPNGKNLHPGNNERRRSSSLCAQLKADCQAISAISYQHALNQLGNGGKKSSEVMSQLSRLRIQSSYKSAKPSIGHAIFKRACSLRSDFRMFLSHLNDEQLDELANDIYILVTECVANVEYAAKVASVCFGYGEMHAQHSSLGFRPEFFSTIADAIIAECLRLDGGSHKRCETLMAWSQLVQFMFSNVRDGFYAEVRVQRRRSSLPQHRMLLKQQSIASGHRNGYKMVPSLKTAKSGSVQSGSVDVDTNECYTPPQ